MIVRVWRATAAPEKASAYVAHFDRNVVPELKTIAGFAGASLLQAERGPETEIVVQTRWASMAAIRAFAGDDVTKAVVEPEAKAALLRFDKRVVHYSILREV